MLGSAILISSTVVHVRRKAFERRLKRRLEEHKQERGEGGIGRHRDSSSAEHFSGDFAFPEIDGLVDRGRATKSSRADSHGDLDRVRAVAEKESTGGTNTLQHHDFSRLESAIVDGEKQIPSDVEFDQLRKERSHGSASYDDGVSPNRIRFVSSPHSPLRARRHTRVLSMQGVGARPDLMNHPHNVQDISIPRRTAREVAKIKDDILRRNSFLTPSAAIGRNSNFYNLTSADREQLGGVEYRAVTLLAFIVPVYFVLWQLLGSIGLGAYIAANRADTTLTNGLNPWWVGAFNAVSAFNNSGMSLLDANMVAFQTSIYTLITMGLLILAGNTCYPVFLRLIIWGLSHLLPNRPKFEQYRVTLRFLLDHPRRCYTNLFPSKHTWWLLGTIMLLNGIDWAAFEVLNIGNNLITSLPRGVRVLDGLFQAVAVRSGGFYVVAVPNLRIGLLVLYVLMMYISVYPVVITMRNSNVYEERSLGIYADDPPVPDLEKSTNGAFSRSTTLMKTLRHRMPRAKTPPTPPTMHTTQLNREGTSRTYFVRQQLRGQLAHDLWWIVLAILFITITETSSFERDPVDYSVFNIIFEVISAYGCVGISVGLPNVAYSFCGGWHTLSKLILCAVMIRGRHRGLPVAIDKAVLLPEDTLGVAEEEDAQLRLEGTMSREWEAEKGIV
ncbi:hypothetical protein MMC09_002808 [Bachmanniomyces sp. S44760]|nr:hypothetical protein [Bachmanniomyces sp. S44760]